MGAFVRGDVVVAPFPFSDLSGAKRRPALVVATLSGDDVIPTGEGCKSRRFSSASVTAWPPCLQATSTS